MNITIRPAVPEDADRFDIRENQNGYEFTFNPLELRRMIETSYCAWAGRADDTIACMWGCILPNLLDKKAFMWVATGPLVDEHPFLFARYSREVVRNLPESLGDISGLVHCRYKRSQRWLRWLGFDILGGYDDNFLVFRRRRN